MQFNITIFNDLRLFDCTQPKRKKKFKYDYLYPYLLHKNYNFLNLFLNPVFLHPSLVASFYHQLIFPRSGNDHQKTDITL